MTPLATFSQVTDEMSGVITSRNYDTDSRIIQETLGNGLSSTYEYDPLGRLISLHLPDGSGVKDMSTIAITSGKSLV